MTRRIEAESNTIGVSGKILETLVVDDCEFDRRRIRRFSNQTKLPISLSEVSSLASLKEVVCQRHFDLILLDYHLADGDGFDGLDIIQNSPFQKNAGVIMVTGDGHTDTAVSAFRKGYHDYVSKGNLTSEIVRDAMLRTLNTVSELQYRNLSTEQFSSDVRKSVIQSLRGAESQEALKEMMSELTQKMRDDLKLEQDNALGGLFLFSEEDDQFNFNG